jgi:DNA-binding CsgD family transcriptional regulator/PAS domain-containing protein
MRRPVVENLLEVLYGVDFGEGNFTPFLNSLGLAMRSHVVALQAYGPSEGHHTQFETSIGLTTELLDNYRNVASDNLWFIRGGPQLLSEGITDDERLDCAGELHRTLCYADFLHPAEIEHGMALCLHRGGDDTLFALTINRDRRRGCFNDDERQLARTLLPHLRNAYGLMQRLNGLQARQLGYRAALDRLQEGVFLLATGGRILFANEQAQRIEAAEHVIRREHGRLAASCGTDDRSLRQALARIDHPDGNAPQQNVLLHDNDDRLLGFLTLSPAPPAVLTPWSEPGVAAIAFVKVLSATRSPGVDRLRATWGFTRAESRLADLLMQGVTLEAAAQRTGISKNTVRTQLRGLFEKTETHRQAELVALLLQAP